MGLIGKFNRKTEKNEDVGIEHLTFKEADWTKVRNIVLADGRHVDLVKTRQTVDEKETITYTVLMSLTRTEAIDFYSELKAAGVTKFTNHNDSEK